MVKCLTPAFSRGDGYIQVIFNPALANEVFDTMGSEADIKRRVLGTGFT